MKRKGVSCLTLSHSSEHLTAKSGSRARHHCFGDLSNTPPLHPRTLAGPAGRSGRLCVRQELDSNANPTASQLCGFGITRPTACGEN